MLRTLRKAAGTWVVRIFLLVLAALFGVGIWSDPGSLLRDRTATSLATIDDIEVKPQDFAREYQVEAGRARALLGARFDNDPEMKMTVATAVIDRMAMRTQFGLETRRMGLSIGDDLVRRMIFANPAFRDGTGAFSADIFAGRLAQMGLTEAGFVAQTKNELASRFLVETVAALPGPPATLINRIHAYRDEARIADFVLVRSADRPAPGEPDEAQIQAYFLAHHDDYVAPEYRAATVVELDPARLAEDIVIAEEDARALYDERADTYQVPERRVVDQIVLASEAQAREAADRIAKGETMEAVAAALGRSIVPLGTLARADFILPALADAAFALSAGQASGPVQSPLGWHVVRVDAVEPPTTVSFEEARPALEEELALDKAADRAYELINDFEDALAAGAGLEEAATEVGLTTTAVPAVAITGLTSNLSAPSLPDPRDRFLEILFATPAGSIAPLEETPQGGFFVARTDAIEAPRQKELSEVREEVVRDWMDGARDRAAADIAAQGAARLAAGETLAAIAASAGTSVVRTQPFTRAGAPANAPFGQELVDRLFAAETGSVTTAPAEDGSGHLVVRLAEIRPVTLAQDAASVNELRREVIEGIANDLADAYRATLVERYPVDVNRALLEPLL
jgi:peptidyl-prolyl cis-trans isomerase D